MIFERFFSHTVKPFFWEIGLDSILIPDTGRFLAFLLSIHAMDSKFTFAPLNSKIIYPRRIY
ncbi:hypothetical protein LEP1GSC047_1592 [Leptospira inadai serovar Lyme str. 10]|uniref:Uncharacterized protein n=1 Tax=Leptospira inadai serovar Lyme str. 10 TaxID=1049790 RepID=V6HAX2_9LEPT|nr:hypothetical protein LEP1GSC047_1592 [Leptospira inadai serovar Lyme str. 10]